jgi:hypothetical protein
MLMADGFTLSVMRGNAEYCCVIEDTPLEKGEVTEQCAWAPEAPERVASLK